MYVVFFFFFQAEDGIRDFHVTGVQTCALPISLTIGPMMTRGKVKIAAIEPPFSGVTMNQATSVGKIAPNTIEIGRASCRERVESSRGAGALKKKQEGEDEDNRDHAAQNDIGGR